MDICMETHQAEEQETPSWEAAWVLRVDPCAVTAGSPPNNLNFDWQRAGVKAGKAPAAEMSLTLELKAGCKAP